MIERRTFLQGVAVLAATQLLPSLPALASPSMTHWEESKDEYLRRVHLYCKARFEATFVLYMHPETCSEHYPFFVHAVSMWGHIGRVTLAQTELPTDRPATPQVMEAVNAEVQRRMTNAKRHPVKHIWLESLPHLVKHDLLRLVMQQAPSVAQSIEQVQAYLHQVPFRTPWKDIA
jgi:hypothetical protein